MTHFEISKKNKKYLPHGESRNIGGKGNFGDKIFRPISALFGPRTLKKVRYADGYYWEREGHRRSFSFRSWVRAVEAKVKGKTRVVPDAHLQGTMVGRCSMKLRLRAKAMRVADKRPHLVSNAFKLADALAGLPNYKRTAKRLTALAVDLFLKRRMQRRVSSRKAALRLERVLKGLMEKPFGTKGTIGMLWSALAVIEYDAPSPM